MGSLVKNIGYTEANATLELLDQYGITPEGLKQLRTRTSPAILMQLARFIEAGSVSEVNALSAFTAFNAEIRDVDLDEIQHWWVNINEKRWLDNTHHLNRFRHVFADLPPMMGNFILLQLGDFGRTPIFRPNLEKLIDQTWLDDWSCENLVGFSLKLCRQDTAPYLGKIRGEIWSGRRLWVASEPPSGTIGRPIFRLENCENGILRLQMKGIKQDDCYVGDHIVFQIVKK
jgi:hypothetical protein